MKHRTTSGFHTELRMHPNKTQWEANFNHTI